MSLIAGRLAHDGVLSPLKLGRCSLGETGGWLPIFPYQLTRLEMEFETFQYFLEGGLHGETEHNYVEDFPKDSPFGGVVHFDMDFGMMGVNSFDAHARGYIEEWRRQFSDGAGKKLSFVIPGNDLFDSRTTAIEVTAAYRTETSINLAELINILHVWVEYLDITEVTQNGPNRRGRGVDDAREFLCCHGILQWDLFA